MNEMPWLVCGNPACGCVPVDAEAEPLKKKLLSQGEAITDPSVRIDAALLSGTLTKQAWQELRNAVGEKTITDPETGGMKGQKLAQFSQIPPDVLLELAEHYGKGNAKYPDDEAGKPNWQRGYSWRLSVDALGRHLLAFLAGEDTDPDTGSSHLVAVMWHAMTLRWFQTHEKGTDYR